MRDRGVAGSRTNGEVQARASWLCSPHADSRVAHGVRSCKRRGLPRLFRQPRHTVLAAFFHRDGARVQARGAGALRQRFGRFATGQR